MKELLERGALFAVIAVLVTAATAILALIAFGVVMTLIGNLSFWPAFVALLFGAPFTPETAFVIGLLMLAIIIGGIRYFPAVTEGTLTTVAAIYVGGIFYFFLFGVLGLPAFFILKDIFGLDLPGWSILPIGVLSLIVVPLLANQLSSKPPRPSVRRSNNGANP